MLAAAPSPAHAVLEIEDRGPVLNAPRFSLRVSNVGVLGNPWYGVGRSFDPSFEYPTGSGHELLGHAELWVGAVGPGGIPRVSGGPMLEWRPTLAPEDRVLRFDAGYAPGRWGFDDDHDGRVDEDPPNGRDDDGDGLVDEDFDLPAQQLLTAEFTDDQPEAIQYGYSNGEKHEPLHLAVHQEVMGWSQAPFDGIAAIRFVVTNKGTTPLHEVRLALYADLDARDVGERGGHLNDRVERLEPTVVIPKPDVVLTFAGANWRKHCFDRLQSSAVAVLDGLYGSGLPAAALVPISHTTDPLALLKNFAFTGVREALAAARAPALDTTFKAYVFAQDLAPGQGGPPLLDEQRWAALRGEWPQAPEHDTHDYAVLLTCGPFSRLDPGASVEFSVALVAVADPDSLSEAVVRAQVLHRGTGYDTEPDDTGQAWLSGNTGVNGHEICFEPPPGVVFTYDPHCPEKFRDDPGLVPDRTPSGSGVAVEVTYASGHCYWTDLDCDACTGVDGSDRWRRWWVGRVAPPAPRLRSKPGDGEVVLEWDDWPEVALLAGRAGDAGYTFDGYKVYRLDRWDRRGLMPPADAWQRIAVFRADSSNGGRPLSAITDDGVPPAGSLDGHPYHQLGRYRFVDSHVLDGFDYHYAVTAVLRAHAPHDTASIREVELESPFLVSFDDRVRPRVAARGGGLAVWVAPNPYRAHAEWERPSVPGDVFTRRIDFLGLPAQKVTIRIYTVAGDFVDSIEHDGSGGSGQVSWNLISRNGQDVTSGIYLFTVDCDAGHQRGRFVVIR